MINPTTPLFNRDSPHRVVWGNFEGVEQLYRDSYMMKLLALFMPWSEEFISSHFILSDYPIANGMSNFQDPATNNMYAIINLHDDIMFYLIFILMVLVWLSVVIVSRSGKNLDHFRDLSHGNLIETIWTVSPALILWMIGIPSLKLLYIMDNLYDSQLTIQIAGNQWYWSYTYSDYEDISYDSFLVDESDLEMGDLRLLTVDNYLVLPINTNIRLLITSNDVVHSFAVPSLGIKCDAVPGRLNSIGLIINRPSVFYGQCSELCGILHGFMPIGVKGVTLNDYLAYIESQ